MTFYGNFQGKSKTGRKNGSPEHDIQVALTAHIENISTPSPLYSATVGGVRLAMHTAKKMKQAGYKKGIPDLLIFEPRGPYAGLAIEVKTDKGRPSPHQKEWIAALNSRGWRADICKGLDACIQVVDEYFGKAEGDQLFGPLPNNTKNK
jgi:hypothetical protein